jgi:zinc/manganese transport system substrate-binding protein
MTTLLTTLLTLACVLPMGTARAQSDDAAPLRVLCTIPTYASLAHHIGGDLVETVVLCRPGQDLHQVTATPALMARARGAELLLQTGLDAEPWLEPLLRSSNNVHLLQGNPRSINLSQGIPLKQVPPVLSRSLGDQHAMGNPHVWTDPYHVRTMSEHVRDALMDALPKHAETIRANHATFHTKLTKALIGWLTEFQPLKGAPVVSYHQSWTYLIERLGLDDAGTLEPKPRVVPTVAHMENLVEAMNARGVTVIVSEPWQFPEPAEFVTERTQAKSLVISTHPGYPEGTEDVLDHFDHNMKALKAMLTDEAQAGGDR